MANKGNVLLYLILLFLLVLLIGGSYVFLKKKSISNNQLSSSIVSAAISPTPSVTVIPTTFSDTNTNVPTEVQYKQIETYGVEITDEQHSKLLNYLNASDVSFDDAPSYYFGKNDKWYFTNNVSQNHDDYIKGQYLCESVSLWCGGLNPNDPQSVKDEKANCQTYNVNINDPKKWMSSNTGQCCRMLSTNKPYVLSCANTSRDPNKRTNDDLQYTYNLLKSSGADCNNYNCLPALETEIMYY